MDNPKELPQRKPTRLKNFDYSSQGAYFLTICTEDRKRILSRIVGGDVLDAPRSDVPDAPKPDVRNAPKTDVLDAPKYAFATDVELLPHGKICEKYIRQMNDFYDDIKVDRYVIMPNHIHIMLFVFENGASRTSPPTARQHSIVSRFVSTFKRFCNKDCGENFWQRHFYDHIIRDREDYEKHIEYIYNNPLSWYYDELYAEK
jgi:REP element-mobilizing transposase RayT